MWGMATLAMELSSASMKVARVTVMAMTHGLARGRHVSWKEAVAEEASFFSFRAWCVPIQSNGRGAGIGRRRLCHAARCVMLRVRWK